MIDISIIIVSYNVKYFLEQCINSIFSSDGSLEVEVIIVDNNSTDGTQEYLSSIISSPIEFIMNSENVGFASANNQGILQARGKYVLLLNPDTVIQNDTLKCCFDFAEINPSVGAIGVKMIDGKGLFLKESKRSLPTPINSFWKLTGLSSLFPKSKIFSAYNLGYISENDDAEVEVLCGAFMFMPRAVLNSVDLLDEDYFMYGEDIDLSYKIKKGGFKVWYLGSHKIIHYKGQSTSKTSISYVKTFYNAMSIFAKKHYGASWALLFILSLAITFRQFGSIISRIFKSAFPLVVDAFVFTAGFILIKNTWAKYQFGNIDYYSDSKIEFNIITYVIIWLLVIWGVRSYSQYTNKKVYALGVFLGFVVILIAYGLFPLEYRSSRAIIFFGTAWVLGIGLLIRYLSGLFISESLESKRIGIVGSEIESNRTKSIIRNAVGQDTFTIQLDPVSMNSSKLIAAQEFDQLTEIVFCLKDITLERVLDIMSENIAGLTYKLIGDRSLNIIGSKSSNEAGEVYGVDIRYQIEDIQFSYYKRCIDILMSTLLITFSPLLFFSLSFRENISISKLFKVIAGKMTLVGYKLRDSKLDLLPTIKTGVIPINSYSDESISHEHNANYALHYTPWRDVVTLVNTIF